MNNPKITIIVPVYNVEDYLAKCIDSVRNQDWGNMEIILVDDGSTDSSGAICDRYVSLDGRISVVHKPNAGQASARNAGLAVAKGNYIFFLDSDDYISPNTLSALYKNMMEYNADIVIGGVVRFTVDGHTRPYHRENNYLEMDGCEALKLLLEGKRLNISVWGVLYRYEIIKNLQMPVGMKCEDWYSLPEIYLKREVTVLYNPETYYFYRDNSNSTMGTMRKHPSMDIITVAQHVMEYMKANNASLYKETVWFNGKRVWKWVGIVYHENSRKENMEFLEAAREFFKKNWKEMWNSTQLTFEERAGLFTFCYLPIGLGLLYKVKRGRRR